VGRGQNVIEIDIDVIDVMEIESPLKIRMSD